MEDDIKNIAHKIYNIGASIWDDNSIVYYDEIENLLSIYEEQDAEMKRVKKYKNKLNREVKRLKTEIADLKNAAKIVEKNYPKNLIKNHELKSENRKLFKRKQDCF